MESTPQTGSLVLWRKMRPGLVKQAGKKLEIELEGGEKVSVRPKDVELLHPGPLDSLSGLLPEAGEVGAAWELLAGSRTDLAELAELAYGTYTPSTAWAAWGWVADGLYFQGTPGELVAQTAEEVAAEQAARQARAAEEQAWAEFVAGLRRGRLVRGGGRFLRDVEDLAVGRAEKSRVLRELGRTESAGNAHALLLELGHWDHTTNPHPQRLGLPLSAPTAALPELPAEERADLTHLAALAIDDEGNQEPDDALSLEGNRLWVHVADVAAVVAPGSPADVEARARGLTLYLPDGPVPMLPPAAVTRLGLGLVEVSPALSFALDLDGEGLIRAVDVVRSWVRVTRLTYEQAEDRLDEEPLRRLYLLARAYGERRAGQGAVTLNLPEVRIWLEGDRVQIQPVPPLRSRDLVTEAMLAAGEAAALWALERGLPMPFTRQEPPAVDARTADLAGMFALRRSLRPSEHSTIPGPHAGLGLPVYAQATSPLRRYLDLVVHQQLRACLRGEQSLTGPDIVERVGATAETIASVRSAERLSRQHWTLVYLQQHPGWQGEGVLVDKVDQRGTVVVPELDLDVRVHLHGDLPLNSSLRLALVGVNLPLLAAHFRPVPSL